MRGQVAVLCGVVGGRLARGAIAMARTAQRLRAPAGITETRNAQAGKDLRAQAGEIGPPAAIAGRPMAARGRATAPKQGENIVE
jgi:hypothetical protein